MALDGGLHDVLDLWLGKSEQNLHGVFETARRHTTCVLFLDEVDALGHSGGRNVVVQLLTELDSTRNDNEGVSVLGRHQPAVGHLTPSGGAPGASTACCSSCPRCLGSGRHRALPPPGSTGGPEGDPVRLGAEDRRVGDHLRLLCESAAELALVASMETGTPRPISTDDFEMALREVKPGTRPWFEVARNHAFGAGCGSPDVGRLMWVA